MSKRVVIVGGVAAGMKTAARLRRLDAEAEIIVLERGPQLSYGACGFPYFISVLIVVFLAFLRNSILDSFLSVVWFSIYMLLFLLSQIHVFTFCIRGIVQLWHHTVIIYIGV